MKKFDYVVVNDQGIKQKGSCNAANEEAAVNQLRETYSMIISVMERKKWGWQIFGKPSLSLEEKMMFTQHLAIMLRVGITVTEALEILQSQAETSQNRKMYANLIEMVKSGQSLSKSLNEYKNIFPEIFVNMIATGENSGTLEKVLDYLGVQLEKEYELRKKIISAFIYPAVITGVTLVLMAGIVIFIMPKITNIFTSFEGNLPLPTRILIGLSTFVTDKPLLAVLSTFGVVLFLTILFKLKSLKPFWHRIVLHLPVFGKLMIYANLARFSRTMNSLLGSGVPIAEALKITGNMIGNHIYKKILEQAQEKVEKGGKLSEALEKNRKLFPPLATRMLYIGETTGNLEKTSKHLAMLYERNVDSITKNLSVLLEPILLVFMGVLIGGVAISVILPIYQLPNLISR